MPRTRKTGPRCHGCGHTAAPIGGMSRCPGCRDGRRDPDQAYRAELAAAKFPAAARRKLLRALAAGKTLRNACAALDITTHRVFGFRAYDPTWSAALDEALMAGRNPDLDHGSLNAYHSSGCRCPECRAAHNAART